MKSRFIIFPDPWDEKIFLHNSLLTDINCSYFRIMTVLKNNEIRTEKQIGNLQTQFTLLSKATSLVRGLLFYILALLPLMNAIITILDPLQDDISQC